MKIVNTRKSAVTRVCVVRTLPKVERPSFADTIKFPESLIELSSANISELLGRYTLLFSLVNQDLASVNIDLLRTYAKETAKINEMFRRNPSMNSQERWKRDAIIEEDPDIEAIRSERSLLLQTKELCEMYLKNYESYTNALSRELTRKMAEESRIGLKYQA